MFELPHWVQSIRPTTPARRTEGVKTMLTLSVARGRSNQREVPLELLCESRLPLKEEESMKCVLCDREARTSLCKYHDGAENRLKAAYQLWVSADGSIEWNVYLDRVITNDQTGLWAKEVAKLLRGDRND